MREAAQRDKKMRFNNLLNHVTPELLVASFFEQSKGVRVRGAKPEESRE